VALKEDMRALRAVNAQQTLEVSIALVPFEVDSLWLASY
jgi:hypothetical protein